MFCGQNVEFSNIKSGVIYICSNRWVLSCQCWRFECSGTRQRVNWNTSTGVSQLIAASISSFWPVKFRAWQICPAEHYERSIKGSDTHIPEAYNTSLKSAHHDLDWHPLVYCHKRRKGSGPLRTDIAASHQHTPTHRHNRTRHPLLWTGCCIHTLYIIVHSGLEYIVLHLLGSKRHRS
jgi:hypothetical protein